MSQPGSLDTQRGREVLELLRELCRERGVAVVLVSHDPMAAHYADRVLALRDGRLGDYDERPAPGEQLRPSRLGSRAGRSADRRVTGTHGWALGEPAPRASAAVKAVERRCSSTGCGCARGSRRSASRSSGIAAGRGAAVRLAGLQLQPAELGQRSSRAGSSATRRCSCWRATRTAFPQGVLARVRRRGRRARRRAAARSQRQRERPARQRSRSQLVGADASLAQLGGTLVRARRTHPVRRDRRGRAAGAARARARSRRASARKSRCSSPGTPSRRRSTRSWANARSARSIAQPRRDRAALYAQEMAGPAGTREPHPRRSPPRARRPRVRAALAALAAGA